MSYGEDRQMDPMSVSRAQWLSHVGADRASWLEWRRGGIGGSDIAAIVGLSPWASKYSVWVDKLGLVPATPENDAQSHGRYAEHAIKAWFEDTQGLHVIGEQRWCSHASLPWARCTPDGFLTEGNINVTTFGDPVAVYMRDDGTTCSADPVGLVEFKVSDFKRWDDGIPDHYQAQAQWQMFVTGLSVVVFAVMHGKRFERYDLERDDDDIAYLRDAAEAFWHDHVVTGQAPATDGSNATTYALNHRWRPERHDDAVDLDKQQIMVIEELRYSRSERIWWEQREETLTNQVKELLGEHTVGRVDGKDAVTWRPSQTNRIDTKALRAAHPDIAKQFTKTTDTRPFLVK